MKMGKMSERFVSSGEACERGILFPTTVLALG